MAFTAPSGGQAVATTNPPQGSFPPEHRSAGAPEGQAVATNPPQGSFPPEGSSPPEHRFAGASEGHAVATNPPQGAPGALATAGTPQYGLSTAATPQYGSSTAATPQYGSSPPQHTGAPGGPAAVTTVPQGRLPPIQHTLAGASGALAAMTITGHDQSVMHPGRRGRRHTYVDAAEALAAAAIPDHQASVSSQGPGAPEHNYAPYSSGHRPQHKAPRRLGAAIRGTAPTDGRQRAHVPGLK